MGYNQNGMQKSSFLPPFGKIFVTSAVLFIIGGAGLGYIFLFLEPRLGPRWLMYFFLTLAGSGISLPFLYLLQRRITKEYVSTNVLLRESIFFAIFLDLLLWMQIGRMLTNLIIFLLAAGLILLEFFLRMAEKASFRAMDSDE